MNRSSVITAWVFCAVFLLVLAVPPRVAAKPLLSEKQIFDQLNQERQKAGLPILEWNDLLAEAARSHSQMMAENDKLAHQLAGEPPLQERIALQGVRFTRAGENIALTGYVEDVHLALMTSAGHRANMLNPKYNAVGIGVIEQNGKIYVTQDFAFQVPVYSEAEFVAALAERLQLPERTQACGRSMQSLIRSCMTLLVPLTEMRPSFPMVSVGVTWWSFQHQNLACRKSCRRTWPPEVITE